MVTCERDGTIVLSIVAVSRSFHTLAQPSRGWRVELSGDERLVSDTKRSRRRTSSCLVMNVWCLTPTVHATDDQVRRIRRNWPPPGSISVVT